MATGRKITATFEDGTVLSRRTKTATLAFAWRCHGANWWETEKAYHSWVADGFASSREKAHRAATSCGWGPKKRIDKIEIVECVEEEGAKAP